jgi:hypothetical protein
MIAFTRLLSVASKRWTFLIIANLLVCLAAIGFSKDANALGTQTGTVTNIYVNATLGSLAFITLSGTKSSNPSCSTGPWSFVLNLTNGDALQQFAMLLTARTTQTPITLTGSGVCDIYSSVEGLWVVSY